MHPPAITISIDSWMGGAFALGFLIPLSIAALAGGYILGTYVVERFNKTHLGIHIRHFMTRIAPTKFFPEDHVDDRIFVIETINKAIADGRISLKKAIRK